MNQVILVGRIGNEVECKAAGSGTSYCRLSIATSGGKAKDGTKTTIWNSVVLFGKSAETAGKYLKKGSEILFVGRVEQTKNKEGKYETNIIGERFEFIGAKSGATHDSGIDSESDAQNLPF
jgi:single-strand DNA-binding protein